MTICEICGEETANLVYCCKTCEYLIVLGDHKATWYCNKQGHTTKVHDYCGDYKPNENVIKTIPFNQKEAMASGISVLGGRQCGKSTLAMALTDIIQKQAIVYVVDPSTAWLTRKKDFNALTIPEPTTHSVTLTWNFKNTVFDVSQLGPEQQRDFTELLAKATMQTQISLPQQARTQVFVWLEEAHNSLPNWIFQSKRMPELKRLITVGANFNVSFGLITQFAAEVSKLPIKATQQRYFGLTSEPNDIRYIRNFIGKEQAEQLKNLDTGEFFYSYRSTLTRFRNLEQDRNKHEISQPQTVFSYTLTN